MAYASIEQLVSFTGITEEGLPSSVIRMLQRASELVDAITLGRINLANDNHLTAAQNAVCAQVEYWLQYGGDQVDIIGSMQSVILGDLQLQFGAGDSRVTPTFLAPRARNFLFLAGLLSRAVSMQAPYQSCCINLSEPD